MKPTAIFLMGPTASGKTQLAVELTQRFPVEIISVDSALVFRDMNIGTAKPDADTLARAPHHLIDLISPTEAYSAAAFRQDALRLMTEITARGNTPLLVGGTMLYFKVLRDGLSPLPPANAQLRAELNAEIAKFGIEHLHRQLMKVDAETATRLAPTDTQRIQRAIEVFRLSGQPMSVLFRQQNDSEFPFIIKELSLYSTDRALLHQRIANRFAQMLKQGLVEELRALRQCYELQSNFTSMRCVGYRQAWQFLEGEITATDLYEQGVAATRQLAKRQLTWLRGMSGTIEFDCLATDLLSQVVATVEDV